MEAEFQLVLRLAKNDLGSLPNDTLKNLIPEKIVIKT